MSNPYVIIIEDDPSLGEIYQAALKQIGFEVGLDKMGDQFKDMLESNTPLLIILDLRMPYARGEDILMEIRSNERWKDIPVVIITADLINAKKFEGKEAQVLIKPVSASRLREIAANMVLKFNHQA